MRLPIAENPQAPWYGEGLRFDCTGCGNCCTGTPGYVWISSEEIGRLAEHLKLPAAQVVLRYCRQVGTRYSLTERLTPRGEYDCIFLREGPPRGHGASSGSTRPRHCAIYPVRPLQCRTWPFWDGLLADRQAWRKAAKRCPGIDRGRAYSRTQIDALRDASEWP
jgi:uncharacterized protein